MNHWRDIDGLRAIAVLSVILFHMDKALLPGGFVGVDIFFVISGFLITGNIVRESDEGRFSLIDFYARRVKRIAPVLMVVITVTLLASHALLLPEDARAADKSAVWSLLSGANVYFWLYQDTSYFAPDNAERPFLHLWSLGVEEQFYALWPLLLMMLYRARSRRTFIACAALAACASYFLASRLFDSAPSFVYYMLPTRAGELLLGAIVAIAVQSGIGGRVSSWLASLMAAAGILMIAASLALLNERQPFPGWLAIPPTLGTALVILAGRCGEKRLSLLLSVRPMVAVGLISYSAYLWHWPMFALYRYGYGRVSIEAGAVMLVATLVLSWMSYRYVEQPARRSKAEPMRIIARFYAAPAAALLVVTATALYPDRVGIAINSEGYRRRLESLRSKTQSPNALYSACQRPRILPSDVVDPRCVMGAPSAGPPGAILWGDSNAVHYVGMIDVFARTAGFRFRNIEVGTCPPIFSDPAPYARATRVADCRASTEVIRPALDDYPVIIVSSSWTLYQRGTKGFLEDFYETASALTRTNKTVIIIGKVPFVRGYDRRCRERALSYPFLHCRDGDFDLPPDIAATNAELRRFAESNPNIHYFDATEYLCPNGRCRVLRDNGDPWYFDTSHLTLAASYELGEKIVAREGVPAMFTAITHTAGSGTR